MYLKFAWRYFKAKKSAQAINLIAWVTTAVIAIATCCQVVVLSVFNGFEDLVKSLYSSFYNDIKIVPEAGKTFHFSAAQFQQLKSSSFTFGASAVAEEKALLKNGEAQTVVNLKGVDTNFAKISEVPGKLVNGNFNLGNLDEPEIIVGSGIQIAAAISLSKVFQSDPLTIILPKKNSSSNDPFESISEGNVTASGVFSIQQDFDNTYALTNIDFLKRQLGFEADEYSAIEIKLKPGSKVADAQKAYQKMLPKGLLVQSRYEQNSNLYATMRMEKWAIFAVLTLILIIAAFNIISALTMLVLEKKKDISILKSMGSTKNTILKIFLGEGLLLAGIGAFTGILLAVIICVLQLKFKLIKLQGGSFLIDYFPVKLVATDFLLVAGASLTIAFIASWFPARKAAAQPITLK